MSGSKDTSILIGASTCKEAVAAEKTLEGRLKAAFREMTTFWLTGDEDVRFRSAICAVLLAYHDEGDDATCQRINQELKGLQMLSAATQGIPVDFGAWTPPENPIGLMGLWGNAKEEAKGKAEA